MSRKLCLLLIIISLFVVPSVFAQIRGGGVENREMKEMRNQETTPASPPVVSEVTFTGTGLNNLTTGGTYANTVITTFTVIVDGTGSPNTFKWKQDAGAFTTGVAMTGSAQTLAAGITITWATTSGHTLNDQWVIKVIPMVRWFSDATGNVSLLKNDGSVVDMSVDLSFTLPLSKTGSTVSIANIANADISATAAIAYSKLNLTGSVVNADIGGAAAIAYSKLNLATSIVNADISASAAIAYSKLNLSTSIVNADISASAAIGWTKLDKTGSSLADLTTRSATDITSGTLNTARLPAVIDIATGFQIGSAAASGNFLRGNGTNFVSSAIQAADIPDISATYSTKTAGGDLTGTLPSPSIASNAVTYAKMQDVSATSRFLGRITAGAGDPEELTGTQATTLLDAFTTTLKGLAPASGGGTTNFLRADGTWAAPGGGITTLNTLTPATQTFATGTSGTDFNISSATSTHTFNIPTASSTVRGLLGTGTATLGGPYTFTQNVSTSGSAGFYATAGAANSAAFGFSGDTDTGMYQVSANNIGFTTGTNLTLQLSSTSVDIKTGGLIIVGGTKITKVISATAVLDYDLTVLTVEDKTVTVTGAADGDVCTVGSPNGSVTTSIQYTCWISSANTATLRARTSVAGENPASGTFRIQVTQF